MERPPSPGTGNKPRLPRWLAEVPEIDAFFEFFPAEQRGELVALLSIVRDAHADQFEVVQKDDLLGARRALRRLRGFLTAVSKKRLPGVAGPGFQLSCAALSVLEGQVAALQEFGGRRSLQKRLKVEFIALFSVCVLEADPGRWAVESTGRKSQESRWFWMARLWGAATRREGAQSSDSFKHFGRKQRTLIHERVVALMLERLHRPIDAESRVAGPGGTHSARHEADQAGPSLRGQRAGKACS